MKSAKPTRLARLLAIAIAAVALAMPTHAANAKSNNAPRVVNIVNFIRNHEPRPLGITDDVLSSTVQSQIDRMRNNRLSGTFLLQYDALINPVYQTMLKDNADVVAEVGGWWEITQPHVEAAGLQWRGRYSWDWHAQFDFSIGYTPDERIKLVDAYMAKFKEIFGYYPKSVGSWYIDSYTLQYMHSRYGVEASCICRDQVGTDGYTLWGGYWQGAYYPSREYLYMPAQTKQGQVDVPVFRLLGSDPIYQYDSRISSTHQGVVTLEPVSAGASPQWVDWYFGTMTGDPCLGYTYFQAGQENMFTWANIQKGFELQMPRLARLRDEGKLQVITLAEAGRQFAKRYKVTPPTAQVSLSDYQAQGKRSVWFNSRYYRLSIITDSDCLRLRDLHLFNERVQSPFASNTVKTNDFKLFTLPIVDGFNWSNADSLASLRPYYTDASGNRRLMRGGAIKATALGDKAMQVDWPLTAPAGGTLRFTLTEDKINAQLLNAQVASWELDMQAVAGTTLPFTQAQQGTLKASFNGFSYQLKANKATFLLNKEARTLAIKPAALAFTLIAK